MDIRNGVIRSALWLCAMAVVAAAAPAPQRFSITMAALPFGAAAGQRANASARHYEPAPVPDQNSSEPMAVGAAARPRVRPAMFAAEQKQYGGDGYVANSSAQVVSDRNFKPAGGVALKLPLQ